MRGLICSSNSARRQISITQKCQTVPFNCTSDSAWTACLLSAWVWRTSQLSYQPSSARSSTHRGGHRADWTDGGAAGAVGQRGDPHGHPLALLCLGRAGGGEADADHLVDWSKQAKLGKTLKISAGGGSKGDARGWGLMLQAQNCLTNMLPKSVYCLRKQSFCLGTLNRHLSACGGILVENNITLGTDLSYSSQMLENTRRMSCFCLSL